MVTFLIVRVGFVRSVFPVSNLHYWISPSPYQDLNQETAIPLQQDYKGKDMTLMIGKHSVVSIHYTLKDDDGQVMDSSEGKEPLAYLHGENNLIPGLESELHGKSVGSKFATTVEPKDAYGETSDELVQTISKEMFQGVDDVQPGMTFVAQGEGGQQRQVRVVDVKGDDVTIDANHPMAGKTLHFDVEVMDVREATPQEIEHGHVHTGGHDH